MFQPIQKLKKILRGFSLHERKTLGGDCSAADGQRSWRLSSGEAAGDQGGKASLECTKKFIVSMSLTNDQENYLIFQALPLRYTLSDIIYDALKTGLAEHYNFFC